MPVFSSLGTHDAPRDGNVHAVRVRGSIGKAGMTTGLDWRGGDLASGLRLYRARSYFAAHEQWKAVWLQSHWRRFGLRHSAPTTSASRRVAPDETFMDEVLAFCRILLDRAPLAIGMAKHIINTCQNVDTETGRILERLGQSILIGTADNHEGMTAFREKRPPHFINR
jgi:hypothetical protein